MEDKNIKIKVSDMRGDKIELDLSWQSGYEDIVNAFKTVLTFLQYDVEGVMQTIVDDVMLGSGEYKEPED